ncbi:hypothetical protein H8B15_09315 [Hymenobacter sp. BT507]|uniref:Auto-transporter adhesin head GIN domain-containing protein n=1 Tax=Hymenobacter citatus TaxID=2763506 RepID=A0ABR7MJ86_9BACT|nr:hypothetical protein [Hymenobacter citatus]MBC6611121.1 hypothetical protein [Hymenobacter citatus]
MCLLTGQPGWAQRTPAAPRVPAMQPAAPIIQQTASSDTATQKPVALAKRPKYPIAKPLVILNSTSIINWQLMDVNPDDIEDVIIYKGSDAPAQWRSLTANGIINITLKRSKQVEIRILKLIDIGQQLLLSGPISYSVNGMPVAETNLQIANTAISSIKITHATSSNTTTSVEIQTAVMEIEMLPPAPPGTIRIRGVASH